jgi:Ca2+:H+ antiporter
MRDKGWVLSGLIIAAYGMGLALSLKTHREIFSGADRGKAGESAVAVGFGLATLVGVTVLVALASEAAAPNSVK